MPVSGLVVSVADEGAADAVAAAVAGAGPFTLGERVGPRLAVAVEADDPGAAERWHDWLRALPGVAKVDVAFVYADPAEEATRAH